MLLTTTQFLTEKKNEYFIIKFYQQLKITYIFKVLIPTTLIHQVLFEFLKKYKTLFKIIRRK